MTAKKIKPHLLIVGGTGFIGYHLALFAKKLDWKVSSISLNKPKESRHIHGVNYLIIDISNLKELKKKLNESLTYVVNLSGYVKHILFGDKEDEIIKTHFIGLINLTKIFSKKKIEGVSLESLDAPDCLASSTLRFLSSSTRTIFKKKSRKI